MNPNTYSTSLTLESLREEIVGVDQKVPLLDGSERTYVYLDNAASTPSFRSVQNKVNELLQWYSSIHRGSGFKSLISTHAYERARDIVLAFVGADPETDCVIFGKNTTEAINTLAHAIPWKAGDVVITTLMEHHSNDLPWRGKAQVEHVGVDDQGALDLNDLEGRLKKHSGRVRLVAVTGASNVTGFTPPIHQIAELAHQHGALILADCAQLAPHRAIHMGKPGTAQRLDFVSLSGHKMYAPFGDGALVGPKEFFRQSPPMYQGGGTIEVVTLDEVHWAEPPERNEAGSPNVVGAVAMAASMQVLSRVGMEALVQHERQLTHYLLTRLNQMDGIQIYGSRDPERLDDRLGVVSFQLENVHHAKVAAILAFEYGIGVRDGCFCAHPYILHLLQVKGEAYERFKEQVLNNDRSEVPGLVRVSFGCYNTREEIDTLVAALENIQAGEYQSSYHLEQSSGSYYPTGYSPATLDHYFNL